MHPRSGLANRLGVTVLNAPGTVDAGYRGEILVNLVNHDPWHAAKISRGDRIAQLVVQRVERAHFHVVEELPGSVRGCGRARLDRRGGGIFGRNVGRAGGLMFSRGGSGRHARDDGGGRDSRSERPAQRQRVGAAAGRSSQRGPYDVAEAPAGVERLDLGSLQIPAVPEVEVRVQANPEGDVQQVVLVNGENALQLGVFAAPRSEGIWEEVREEIRKSLFSEGVAAEESRRASTASSCGPGSRTADGLTDLRFVGIDGPRWMVRGVFQGPAATDPSAGRRAGRVPARPGGRPRPGGQAGPRAAAAAAAQGRHRPGAGRSRPSRSRRPRPRRPTNGATARGPATAGPSARPRGPAERSTPLSAHGSHGRGETGDGRHAYAERVRAPGRGVAGEWKPKVMATDQSRTSLRRFLQPIDR